MLTTGVMHSPVGPLFIGISDEGVRFLHFSDDTPYHSAVDSSGPGAGTGQALLAETVQQLDQYFAGRRTDFELPLDPQGTPFQQSAWMLLRTIPYGQTVSYAFQARSLGDVNKSRAVGAANGKNPIGIIVPCHRVVGTNGSLTGFGGGVEMKAWLLDHEKRVIAGVPG